MRRQAADIVNFWRARGVRGFRFDVINLIGKGEDLLDAPPGTDDRLMYTDGPAVHAYLNELNRASFGQDADSVTVGEMSSTSIGACANYSSQDAEELDMAFNFHHLKVDYVDGQKWTRMPFDLAALKRVIDDWARGMQDGHGWNALFWNNHDQPRALDRFGDPARYRVESATMLATVIHLLRGTPFVYMGEEIGMTDPLYTTIDDYVDVEAHNAYAALLAGGASTDEAFAIVHSKARDNARTPMQWDAGVHAGFSATTPWLRPTNQQHINVADEARSGQILAYYRRLIELRKRLPIISEGAYLSFALDHPDVLGYVRQHEGQQLLVLANFRGHEADVEVPEQFVGQQTLIGNRPARPITSTVTLAPYEAVAVLTDADAHT